MGERESVLWPPQASPVAAQWTVAPTVHLGAAAAAYRPDIDGLRAVAVTLVIAYHAIPRLLPGGFIGVDIFFVISGYLITQLVLTGLRDHTFSLPGFYQRRVRRIVPALLVVLGACFALGWFVLLPGEFRWLGDSILWSAPFLANLFFARSGYFDAPADYNVLLHLWSLGVEEQFYLIWPLLLMLAARYGATTRVLGAVIGTSLVISLWGARYAPMTHFFLPGSRAWELAVGGMLAARQLGAARSNATDAAAGSAPGWIAETQALTGAVLLAAGAFLLSAENTFPGAWAAVPVAGAALLISGGPRSRPSRWLLGRPLVVLVGRLSYSLYLWHWPLFAFARAIWGRELPSAALAALLALTVVGATVSYFLVERPFRYGALGRRAVPYLLAGLLGFTLLGAATASDGIRGRLSGSPFLTWEAAVNDWDLSGDRIVRGQHGFTTLSLHSKRASTALFIGDSHMEQYWSRVVHVIHTHPDTARSALLASYAGCPTLPGLNILRKPTDCDGFFADATEQAFRPEVDTVVFGAFWELYLLGEYPADRGILWGVYSSEDFTRRPLSFHSLATQIALERFERLLARLVSSGRCVFIVLSNPTSPSFDPTTMIPPRVRLTLHVPSAFNADGAPRVDVGDYESFVAPLMDRLRDIAARSGARVLDPRSAVCEGTTCAAVGADGMPLYIDSNHLRGSFARERAWFIDEPLLGPAPP